MICPLSVFLFAQSPDGVWNWLRSLTAPTLALLPLGLFTAMFVKLTIQIYDSLTNKTNYVYNFRINVNLKVLYLHDYDMTGFSLALSKLLGERIRKHRVSLGLNQAELANQVGIGRASISNIEVGRHQAPLSLLYEISKALNTEIHFLLPAFSEVKKSLPTEKGVSVDTHEERLQKIPINESARLSINEILKKL